MEEQEEMGAHGKASFIGQKIGEAFEGVVIDFVKAYLEEAHSDYEILSPEEGRKLLTLEMLGGLQRQLDTAVALKDSDDPVALLEAKWLKDARHWNDKGAWILQLREIKKKHATIRGAVAVLAGYWKTGVGVWLQSEGGVKMIMVATDDEVYGTLQEPVNEHLKGSAFHLDAKEMRKRFPPQHINNFYRLMVSLEESGQLRRIAETWLDFDRQDENGAPVKGADLIKHAIDELLEPLPDTPKIQHFEISLQLDTGNVIHEKFDDLEDLLEFICEHSGDPAKILERITPKKGPKQLALTQLKD
jgi:hypothetical protein